MEISGTQDVPLLGPLEYKIDQRTKSPVGILLGGQVYYGRHFQGIVDVAFGLDGTYRITVAPSYRF